MTEHDQLPIPDYDQLQVGALTSRIRSLDAAGLQTLLTGEPVDLAAPDGTVVARGLVTYDAIDLPKLIGQRTEQLGSELGAEFARVVVHRDALVVLEQD